MYVYIYLYIERERDCMHLCICICMYVYIYIYIQAERYARTLSGWLGSSDQARLRSSATAGVSRGGNECHKKDFLGFIFKTSATTQTSWDFVFVVTDGF